MMPLSGTPIATGRTVRAISTYLFLLLAGAVGNAGTALAITVKNVDKDARTVIVTERGVRTEQIIVGGGQVSFCAAGCFVRFPNGQMQVFRGDEVITIQNGLGRLSN